MDDGGNQQPLAIDADESLQRQSPLLDNGLLVRRPVLRIGNWKQIAPRRFHHHPGHREPGREPDETIGPREGLDGHRRDFEVTRAVSEDVEPAVSHPLPDATGRLPASFGGVTVVGATLDSASFLA